LAPAREVRCTLGYYQILRGLTDTLGS